MSEQKKRITFDEFILEEMDKFKEASRSRLIDWIAASLTTTWTREDVANELADEGRELVADTVEQGPLKCQMCGGFLNEIMILQEVYSLFRLTREDNTLHLKLVEQDRVKNKKSTCARCAMRVDLSDFEIHYID